MEPFTPTMQELIGLSLEMGFGNRSPQEKRQYLTTKQEIIHQAVQDALGVKASLQFRLERLGRRTWLPIAVPDKNTDVLDGRDHVVLDLLSPEPSPSCSFDRTNTCPLRPSEGSNFEY